MSSLWKSGTPSSWEIEYFHEREAKVPTATRVCVLVIHGLASCCHLEASGERSGPNSAPKDSSLDDPSAIVCLSG